MTRIYSVTGALPDGLPLIRIRQRERFGKLDKSNVRVNDDMGPGEVQTCYQATCT